MGEIRCPFPGPGFPDGRSRCFRLKNGKHERSNPSYDGFQRKGVFLDPGISHERGPLNLFRGIGGEPGRQRGRRSVRKDCFTPRKRLFDCALKQIPVKVEPFRKQPNVIKILQPAVRHVQGDHRLVFFRDDTVSRISPYARRFPAEKRRIVFESCDGMHAVAEANVKLQRHGRNGRNSSSVSSCQNINVGRHHPDHPPFFHATGKAREVDPSRLRRFPQGRRRHACADFVPGAETLHQRSL